jgi:hypothetical protein
METKSTGVVCFTVLAYGSRYFGVAVPKTVPVFGAGKSHNDSAVLGRRHNPGARVSHGDDGHEPRGTCFQTKSFPDPCMCRYRVTSAGRLIDSAGNDLEPDGYITFYTVDREDGDSEAHGSIPGLREYRARFLSGQLQDTVLVNEDSADHVRYGLASFRWFQPRSFMFGDPDETSDAEA